MNTVKPRYDDRMIAQDALRALLTLTRFSRQTITREGRQEQPQELLRYLLEVCRASRGAILLMERPQPAREMCRPLALAQVREEEAHALLAADHASAIKTNHTSEDFSWLLSSIPLFPVGTALSGSPVREATRVLIPPTPLPCSAWLILGWSTETRRHLQHELAYRGALLAQLGDALSVAIMHLLLANSLIQRPQDPLQHHTISPGDLMQAYIQQPCF